MEDFVSAVRFREGVAWFGVFDGHGGAGTSGFASKRIPELLFASDTINPFNWRTEAQKSLSWAYTQAHEEWKTQHKDDGSTAVTVLLVACGGGAADKGGQSAGEPMLKILVANVGDSRAVLCFDDHCEDLSLDHKPTREDEKERIENLGGEIVFYKGAWRVEKILAVTRALGDVHLYPFVIPTPDFREVFVPRNQQDAKYIILASDGLWDVLTSKEASQMIRGCSALKAANILCSAALDRGSTDNITAVVIELSSLFGQ